MTGPLARGKAVLARVRAESALTDHLVRMQEHYGRVNGSAQAGAVTYFAFLSFFPILALGFFVVGYIAKVYADAQENLVAAVQDVLPGLIATRQPDGTMSSGISLTSIEQAATTIGIIGLVGLVYSGLGWLSAMRSALQVVFEMPQGEKPNFVIGKLRDLVTLAVVGTTLLVSVAVTGVVVGYSTKVLDLVGAGPGLTWLVGLIGVAVGVATSMVLFYAMFWLLARPHTPSRALWQGALLGGLAFEALKFASSFLLKLTQNQPAFQAFGIALVLLIWINYFSKTVMYAAAWAYTSRPARAARTDDVVLSAGSPGKASAPTPATPGEGPVAPLPAWPAQPAQPGRAGPDARKTFGAGAGAGAAAALGLVALLRRRRR